MMRRGNCYVASEALWHILGGRLGPWVPQVMRMPDGERHWFLRNRDTGAILDPSRRQFLPGPLPDYSKGRGCGFMTRQPSKRAALLIEHLTWGETDGIPDVWVKGTFLRQESVWQQAFPLAPKRRARRRRAVPKQRR